MFSRTTLPISCVSLWAGLLVGAALMPVSAATAFDSFVGEVVSKKLNVRSGPSTNYYVVTRLVAGDRVEVVGADGAWYAVVPPKGCFSLISATHVDIGADGNGVVNGRRVRVRAGSTLDSHRYAVQLKLDQGAEVRVLGDGVDGFLKIVPPVGAYVWVHEDYLQRVPDARVQPRKTAPQKIAKAATTKAATTKAATTKVPIAQASVEGSLDGNGKPFAAPKGRRGRVPSHRAAVGAASSVSPEAASSLENVGHSKRSTASRTETASRAETFRRIDATGQTVARSPSDLDRQIASGVIVRRPAVQAMQPALKDDTVPARKLGGAYEQPLKDADCLFLAEIDRPIEERDFTDVIKAFSPIAEQETDEIAHLYASRRLEQVQVAATTADAVRRLRGLADGVTKERKDALADRSRLRPAFRPITRGFDAKGELRASMIFTSPVGPRRYRLIDPDQIVPRTLCYVELPREMDIDVSQYLGRLVGVRARSKFIETESNVNPIPIVVAEELVVLDEPGKALDPVDADPVDAAGETVQISDPSAVHAAKETASVAAVSPHGG